MILHPLCYQYHLCNIVRHPTWSGKKLGYICIFLFVPCSVICSFHSFIADFLVQMEGKPKCCFFKFSSKIQYNKVVKAQLWIYLRQVQKPTTVFVQILRLIKPMKDGTRYTGIRSLKLDMNPGTGIWQSIDVKTVLQNWLKQPESNLGIEIKAFDETGRDLAVTFPGPGEDGLVSSLEKSHLNILVFLLERDYV